MPTSGSGRGCAFTVSSVKSLYQIFDFFEARKIMNNLQNKNVKTKIQRKIKRKGKREG